MRPATPHNVATFLRGLSDDLFLPALWLIRRSDLGALIDDSEPDEQLLEVIEDRLFTQDSALYEYIRERRAEN